MGTELRQIVERVIRRYMGMIVGRLAFGLLLFVLVPVVAILGVAVFGLLGVLTFGVYALLGEPAWMSPVVGLGWFFGSLGVIFLVLLRGHRWLTQLLALAQAPALAIDPSGEDPIPGDSELTPSPIVPSTTTFHERLAAADARHSPEHDAEARSGKAVE